MASTRLRHARSALIPRKTPLQGRAEHTVATLIEAAAQVLELAGLEGYNTNAVAARAGVSIGSLYQYFPSKDALTLALMRRENDLFYTDAAGSLSNAVGRQALECYLDAAVRQQLARPRLARLLDIEESRTELQKALQGEPSLRALLIEVLASNELPRQVRLGVVASDLAAIVRALTDAAGERGETDLKDLRVRVGAAVFGYLEGISQADHKNASKPRRSAKPSA